MKLLPLVTFLRGTSVCHMARVRRGSVHVVLYAWGREQRDWHAIVYLSDGAVWVILRGVCKEDIFSQVRGACASPGWAYCVTEFVVNCLAEGRKLSPWREGVSMRVLSPFELLDYCPPLDPVEDVIYSIESKHITSHVYSVDSTLYIVLVVDRELLSKPKFLQHAELLYVFAHLYEFLREHQEAPHPPSRPDE